MLILARVDSTMQGFDIASQESSAHRHSNRPTFNYVDLMINVAGVQAEYPTGTRASQSYSSKLDTHSFLPAFYKSDQVSLPSTKNNPSIALPVLIPIRWVGAGPAGLFLALSLAQSGIQARIVDKSDSFHVGSRGFGVQVPPNIIDDIQELTTPIPAMRAYKLPGGTMPVKTWDLYEKSGVWPGRPYANGACLGQYLLEGVLRDYLAKCGVSVELNKRLAVIEQDARTVTAILAVFRNGVAIEEKEDVVAQYLISDGAKAIEFIKAEIGRIDLEFGEFAWLSHFRPKMPMVNKFQEGPAFVVGDSAHVHSPTRGQGVKYSVQDASNLARKLSLVLKDLASSILLSTYNEERLPVITQMPYAMTQLYTHTVAKEKQVNDTKEDERASGWFRWRNTALEIYGINYRYSSIVLEERDMEPHNVEDVLAHAYSGYESQGPLRAGDRAPDAPFGGTTLFSLFRSTVHTVLVFSKWNADTEAGLKTLPPAAVHAFAITDANVQLEGVSVLVNNDEHARKAYMEEENSPTTVIVRPVSFIGAIITDVEGVGRYFSKILIRNVKQ
ncbi:monooxygenase [Desarmillaria ectypa]|nr:monooxygenase [Desarmillaria ectypa]